MKTFKTIVVIVLAIGIYTALKEAAIANPSGVILIVFQSLFLLVIYLFGNKYNFAAKSPWLLFLRFNAFSYLAYIGLMIIFVALETDRQYAIGEMFRSWVVVLGICAISQFLFTVLPTIIQRYISKQKISKQYKRKRKSNLPILTLGKRQYPQIKTEHSQISIDPVVVDTVLPNNCTKKAIELTESEHSTKEPQIPAAPSKATAPHVKKESQPSECFDQSPIIETPSQDTPCIAEPISSDSPSPSGNDYPLMYTAIDIVVETGMASVSSIQRKMKLGYSIAARMVDQMEEVGIIGPFEGSRPRKVLITKQRWAEMKRNGVSFSYDPAETTNTEPNIGNETAENAEDFLSVSNRPVSYVRPSIDCFLPAPPISQDNIDFVSDMTAKLNDTFDSFRLNLKVSGYHQGAIYTRFDVTVPINGRLSSLRRLASDIAFSVGQTDLRIDPIPNSPSMVGFTLRNPRPTMPALRKGVESASFQSVSPSELPCVIGETFGGDTFVSKVTSGHILISGRTGSGKTSLLESIILSMLFRTTPSDLRMIWIDPIIAEAQAYTSIPHLLIPPIYDQKTVGALVWLQGEIKRRQVLMSGSQRRRIGAYNELQWEQFADELPYIVVIIDGYAKLIETISQNNIEQPLLNILRNGPQVGVYVILSSQNTSTKTMSTALRSCFSTRIVLPSDKTEIQRTIGDTSMVPPHATGEMLYSQAGLFSPIPLCAYKTSDTEIVRVIDAMTQPQPVQ